MSQAGFLATLYQEIFLYFTRLNTNWLADIFRPIANN